MPIAPLLARSKPSFFYHRSSTTFISSKRIITRARGTDNIFHSTFTITMATFRLVKLSCIISPRATCFSTGSRNMPSGYC